METCYCLIPEEIVRHILSYIRLPSTSRVCSLFYRINLDIDIERDSEIDRKGIYLDESDEDTNMELLLYLSNSIVMSTRRCRHIITIAIKTGYLPIVKCYINTCHYSKYAMLTLAIKEKQYHIASYIYNNTRNICRSICTNYIKDKGIIL
jgi:hypothetical protein